MRNVRFIGLDVHAETIAVAVAESGGEVRSLGTIPNRPESVVRLVKKLGKPEQLRACYEAGPTGYVLYWQLTQLGVKCEVVAPTLIPVKAGDRVKTDRRDAEKLARCYRGGDLTAVWVPDAAHEALRDLVRARLAAKRDQLRARNRLSKFLLRHGRRPPEGTKAWTARYLEWIRSQRFEQAAQQVTLEDYGHEVEHAAERIDRCGDRDAAGEDASRGGGAAEPARSGTDQRRVDRGRTWRSVALRGRTAADGLLRSSAVGRLERAASASRQHQQSGQRTSAACRRGSRLVLPASPRHRPKLGGTSTALQRARMRTGLEGAAPAAPALRSAHFARQEQTACGDRRGAGAVGLYLGDRHRS
jgi:hypothetical protein